MICLRIQKEDYRLLKVWFPEGIKHPELQEYFIWSEGANLCLLNVHPASGVFGKPFSVMMACNHYAGVFRGSSYNAAMQKELEEYLGTKIDDSGFCDKNFRCNQADQYQVKFALTLLLGVCGKIGNEGHYYLEEVLNQGFSTNYFDVQTDSSYKKFTFSVLDRTREVEVDCEACLKILNNRDVAEENLTPQRGWK